MRRLSFFVVFVVALAGIGAAGTISSLAPANRPPAAAKPLRLAQIIPDTSPAEATTGNPSLAPLKWVGLLAIPDPTDKDPDSIVECSGQFIKPNIVLTAAHCLRDLPANPKGPW